jgi:uncharacterized protein YdcH (DUF465 family)
MQKSILNFGGHHNQLDLKSITKEHPYNIGYQMRFKHLQYHRLKLKLKMVQKAA